MTDLYKHSPPSNALLVRANLFCTGRTDSKDPYAPDERFIGDIANSIDTTLTAEQQEYVAKLKKKIKGGVNSRRSLYRDVPLPEEVRGLGNFMPRIADNAEALIDYALSHVPPRAGPRRSRRKKRMELRWSTKRKYDTIKKTQINEANLKRHQRRKRISEELRAVKAEAASLYSSSAAAASDSTRISAAAGSGSE